MHVTNIKCCDVVYMRTRVQCFYETPSFRGCPHSFVKHPEGVGPCVGPLLSDPACGSAREPGRQEDSSKPPEACFQNIIFEVCGTATLDGLLCSVFS